MKKFPALKLALKISLLSIVTVAFLGSNLPVAKAESIINTGYANNITYSTAVLSGSITEKSLPMNAWFEFGTDINNLNGATNQNYYNSLSNILSASIGGLASNTTYYFRAVGQNNGGKTYGNILSFRTTYYQDNNNYNVQYGDGTAPGITTSPATNIDGENATLTGLLNTSGLSTSAWFEWGTSTNFTNSTTQNFYNNNINNYSIILNGLKPGTTYYFRAVAQNTRGRVFGNILSFTTAPYAYTNNYYPNTYSNIFKASTNPATKVGSTSAQLNGLIVNSGNIPSTTYFEWGTNNSLGNRTETISTGSVSAVKHANGLTGLSPNTTYYFRIVADNGISRIVGETTYFITNRVNVAPKTQTQDQSWVSTPITNTQPTYNNNVPIYNNVTNTPVITPINSISPADLGASVIGVGFLPGNLFGWLFLIVLFLVLFLLVQYLFFPVIVHQEHVEHH